MAQWQPNPAAQGFGHSFLSPDQLRELSTQRLHGSMQVDAGVIPLTRAHQDRDAAVWVADLEPCPEGWRDWGAEHGRLYRHPAAAVTRAL